MSQHQDLVEIGHGRCGSVWAKRLSNDEYDNGNDNDNDNYTVIKRGDGTWHRSVTKEHEIHKHIARLVGVTASESIMNLITSTGYRVNIPAPIDFITLNSAKWDVLLPLLPPKYKPCIALENERIPPMRRRVRRLLAHTCYGTGGRGRLVQDEKLTAALLDAETNEQNCLVRPYLGRRRIQPKQGASATRPGRPQLVFVTLRNIPLHLDQIEELGLPVEQYAMAMADTMAFLHWEAEIDAADVEFVLAQPRQDQGQSAASSLSIGSKPFTSEGPFGSHAMWLVDFDCCEKMAMPTDDTDEMNLLTIAARAFWRNDPYYPRPPANHTPDSDLPDGKLWETFKKRYLATSGGILERKRKDKRVKTLPGKVMGMIENTRERWSRSVL